MNNPLTRWPFISGLMCSVALSQQPTGKITSIILNQNPVVIIYDLIGSTDEEYAVTLYIMKENDQSSMMKLESVTGNVGTGKFAGIGRQILWDKNELKNPQEGVKYQFALDIRQESGGGLPWYLYPGAVAVGVAVWLAVKPAPSSAPSTPAAAIPVPPLRP